jgi:hypothetical protein
MILAQGTLAYSLTSVMGAIPAEIFESRHYGSIFGTVMLAAILGGGQLLGRGRAVRCHGKLFGRVLDRSGVQHPIHARDLACSPSIANIVDHSWAVGDWTLARALRTGRFWWIAAGYFCACLRTRCWCTIRNI